MSRIGHYTAPKMRPRKSERIRLKCLECGKEFSINPADAQKRLEKTKLPGLFCNRTCYTSYVKRTGYLIRKQASA